MGVTHTKKRDIKIELDVNMKYRFSHFIFITGTFQMENINL